MFSQNYIRTQKKKMERKIRYYGDFTPFLEGENMFHKAMNELSINKRQETDWNTLLPTIKRNNDVCNPFDFYNKNEAIFFYKNNILRSRMASLFWKIYQLLMKGYSIRNIMNGEEEVAKLKNCLNLFLSITENEIEYNTMKYLKQYIHMERQ